MDAFYLPEGDGFVSTEWTRGPWSRDHQHGGPPAALLGRAIEGAMDPAMQLARMTIEFLRPLPIAPMRLSVERTRPGRRAEGLTATLSAGDQPLALAHALSLRKGDGSLFANVAEKRLPSPFSAEPHRFTFFTEARGYHMGMEMRVARGTWGQGAMAVWMRMRIPLVAGEEPSPWQRVLVAADSGNGISAALDPARFTFVNPDLTVYLHRPPEGEWIFLDAATAVGPVGLAQCALGDERGPIGRSLQSLLIEPR